MDRLLSRLERELREPNQQRELSLCLAQAHAAAGDLGSARVELERLISTNPRDTQLLSQLSGLAESEGDYEGAARYQKQAVEIAPSPEGTTRLAMLHFKAGELTEAEAVWARLAGDEEDPSRVLAAVDNLLAHGKPETVLAITERLLVEKPGDWEALYREGVALDALGKPSEAARRFRGILDVKLPDDRAGLLAGKARTRVVGAPQPPNPNPNPGPIPTPSKLGVGSANSSFAIVGRIGSARAARLASKLDESPNFNFNFNPGMGMASSWAPTEFGQARMASLAWLLAIANREGKGDAFVASIREARDKAGAGDPRPRWDWYYLQLVRDEGPAKFEAARDLARALPGNPAAEFAYLDAVQGRADPAGGPNRMGWGPAQGGNDGKPDKTPALARPDLDLALAGYRDLRRKRPEFNPTALMHALGVELKRAGRQDDADRFYREAVEAADDPVSIEAAIDLVAERGGVDELLALQEKVDRLQASKAPAQPGRRVDPDHPDAFAALMARRAEAKAYDDVLRLLDRYLASARSPEAVARRARLKATGSASGSGYSGPANVTIRVGRRRQGVGVDFPQPNVHFDLGAIQVLRNAFEVYRKDDLTSDLVAHLADQAGRMPESEKVYGLLALGYVRWWADDKDEAVDDLTRASEKVPEDVDLRLALADLRARRGEPAEALALVDSVEPLDQKVMQRREVMALRLSVLSGDVERARKASERLFGLRLDQDTQMQLASQMSQLGMHDLAEAVLARARRKAVGNTNSLVMLMNQYQQAGKADSAFQIAGQILRASSNRAASSAGNPNGNPQEENARREAIQVFARSGRLKELIDRAEGQLRAAPGSVQALQLLAEYYAADGQPEKVKETYERLAKVRPDDAKLRFDIAGQRLQAGDAVAAFEDFKAASKKDPSVFASRYWEVVNAAQQAGKSEELGPLFDALDLKLFGGNPWAVQQVVQILTQDEKTRDSGLKLFRKLWKAQPEMRSTLLANVDFDVFGQMPEIYDYAREAILPRPGKSSVDPWSGTDQVVAWVGNGRVVGLADKLLEVATRQNRLDGLALEVDEAVGRHPEWAGGRAIGAMILLRRGKVPEARVAIERLIAEEKAIPAVARMVLGQELDGVKALRDLELRLYEGAAGDDAGPDASEFGFQFGPVQRLVTLYHQAGQDERARDLLLKQARKPVDDDSSGGNPGYAGYMKMTNVLAYAQQMLQVGYPVDAVRFYEEILADAGALDGARQMYGGNDQLEQQARNGLDLAVRAVNRKNLARTLRALVPMPPPPDEKANGRPPLAPVELIPFVNPKELDKAATSSLLSEALTLATSKRAGNPEIVAEVKAALDRRAESEPNDLNAAIARGLVAAREGDEAALARASEALAKLIDAAPLDPLPPGARPNARQRASASKHLAVWLVARECLKREGTRATGEALQARALEAARRQADPTWTLAILREAGQAALDRGDRAAAEAAWRAMLRQVLDGPKPKKPPAGASTTSNGPSSPVDGRRVVSLPSPFGKYLVGSAIADRAPGASSSRTVRNSGPYGERGGISARGLMALLLVAQVPAIPPTPPAAPPPSGPAPTTWDRYNQAFQVANLAIGHDMVDLSAEAVRESLGSGPPIVPISVDNNQPGLGGVQMPNGSSADPVSQNVAFSLIALDAAWSKHKMPPTLAYETLRSAVLPDARPNEAFLYATQLQPNQPMFARSVGSILVRRAVEAGRVDDLTRRIEERRDRPMAIVPSRVLAVQLAVARKDGPAADSALRDLAGRIGDDPLQSTSELACLAAVPALDLAEAEPRALAMIEKATGVIAANNGGQPEPLGTLLLQVARRKLKKGQLAEAKATLAKYLDKMKDAPLQYGGDYSLFFRKQALANVAAEYARAGLRAEAWEMLGRFADAPTSKDYGGEADLGGSMPRAVRMALALPPAERYAMLKAWSMPTADRKSIRLLASLVTDDSSIPLAFGPMPHVALGGYVATPTLLVDAAREAGKLDELVAEAGAAASAKLENAPTLLILARVAAGRGPEARPAIVEHLEAVKKPLTTIGSRPIPPGQPVPVKPVEPADYLIARASLLDPALDEAAEALANQLIGQAQATQNMPALARLRGDLARHLAARAGSPEAAARLGPDPGLAHWHPVAHQAATTHAMGSVGALWAESGGVVAHVRGPQTEHLLLDYPIAGRFEATAETFAAPGAEGQLTYSGLIFSPDNNGMVMPVGGHESRYTPGTFFKPLGYNRVTIRSEPDRLSVLVNGHPFDREDDPSPTAPWLTFHASQERRAAFRGLTISGSPEIPREVRLVHADRLEGWGTGLYNESQPPRMTPKPDPDGPGFVELPDGSMVPPGQFDPALYDWHARDGVLVGRRYDPADQPMMPFFNPYANGLGIGFRTLAVDDSPPGDEASPEVMQGRIQYFRPIRDGESVGYEFLYEPGKTTIHPALDRLAFLVEPGGVKLHWMTDGAEDPWSGLLQDNAVEVPAERRGPKTLPLRPGEWNRATLSIDRGVARLDLNGERIYEHPIESTNQRNFGFYRDKLKVASKARDIVLKGDWPTTLPADLMARRDPNPAEVDRRARGAVVEARSLDLAADSVLAEARALPPDRRPEALADYVLPNPDHADFRLAGSFTPDDPAPPVARGPGGVLESPALELVATAKALGRLDELAGRVEKAGGGSAHPDRQGRGRLALLALIRLAQDRDAEADSALQALRPLLEKLDAEADARPDAPEFDRWPELTAASAGVDRPATRGSALALLDRLDDRWKKPGRADWGAIVRSTRARGRGIKPGLSPEVPGWASVMFDDAETRGRGAPEACWTFADGTFLHHAGRRRDYLYLSTPIRGDFAVDCELSSFGWREAQLSYGGLAIAMMPGGKSYRPRRFGRDEAPSAVDPPFDKLGDWYAFRLEVKDGTYSAFVEGRKVHESRLPDSPDPWLALASLAESNGGVRKLKISGKPEVPEVLALSNGPTLAGWLDDYYGTEAFGLWRKRGEEIVGHKLRDVADMNNPEANANAEVNAFGTPGSKQEDVLRYHRPILEGGEIAYEFYHEPGKAMVHPALDRLAFLIEPDGVKIHRMTDAQHDRTNLAPDNAQAEPDHRRGPVRPPLKPDDWNKLKLTIAGNVATLALNDIVIYEKPLEPENRRVFGLFRYADETEAKVRGVTYRGHWPRTLPASITGQR